MKCNDQQPTFAVQYSPVQSTVGLDAYERFLEIEKQHFLTIYCGT